MEKRIIEVPSNIRYISEWLDFDISILKGHSILNKFLTGCGFTHYCLTNDIPTILCSPRKILLENKHEQIPKTFLVINKNEKDLAIDVDNESGNKTKPGETKCLENFSEINSIKDSIKNYLLYCQMNLITPKILVTYDSLKYVYQALCEDFPDLLSEFSIIVDEFQNIFIDSRFKAEVELDFLLSLQSCPNVTYLSATPYIDEYLDELDEFKSLPYYELKWDESNLRFVDIEYRKATNPSREVDKIINSYLLSNFPEKFIKDPISGELIKKESREVVFYVNSVRMICSIIKRNNLTSDQVNIICSKETKNIEKLSKIGHSIGKAPLKGEPHKMFTFCTRTTYVGADFYSTSALSVIVSDCLADSLVIDIRMDFPQIMGRQRLKENVFRDECIFIYKLSDSDVTLEDYEKMKEEKLKYTQKDINNFNLLIENSTGSPENMLSDVRLRIKAFRYKQDYTGINSKEGKLVINKLVLLSEKRAFELRSNTYKTNVSIFDEFGKNKSITISTEISDQINIRIEQLRELFNGRVSFEMRMKELCDLLNDYKGYLYVSDLRFLPLNYKKYLAYLSPERIKALGYYEANLEREIISLNSTGDLRQEILSYFEIGKKYSLKTIKDLLRFIYEKLNISKTPKASDLEEYFLLKPGKITLNGKRENAFEILSLKE